MTISLLPLTLLFASLISMCHGLAPALETGSDGKRKTEKVTQEGRADEKLQFSQVNVKIPSLTKLTLDLGRPEAERRPEVIGPATHNVSFSYDPGSEIVNEWSQTEVNWLVYRPMADPEKLDDENDLKFLMNCIIQASSQSDKIEHSFKVSAEKPYLLPLEGDTWDSIIHEANMICPTGKCVHKDGYEDLPMPKWDQMFLQEHVPQR
ncbi:hypothetical protein I302_107669 [Kwoniella bestiolae CBS 10118]|uniref:Uncharacterized protein n=1 Tax=Kwoniella bestiolae CBS 10118 TaxID=1296100 RepID=A0A1B9FXW0_9TREE|nr:hypothetical protein I302_06592 [Kwoniella bestiolae CBS 10118]OCF23609.1 hypothetical protein I302_06592 [Kwoniella bestiolae CBS 10118]